MRWAQVIPRALLVATLATLSARARADGDAPAPAAAPAPLPRPEQHFIFGSAIALLMNRVSVGYELFVAPHHSVGLSGYGMLLGITHGGPNVAKGTVFGAGGELGYRYYVGDHGPSGPFAGASFIGGYYHSRKDFYELKDDSALWYVHYGWALDLGWAGYIDRNTALAFAIGAQRTWTSERGKLCDLAQLLVGDGVRPRIVFQVGRLF